MNNAFTTFRTRQVGGVLTVTFEDTPVHAQSIPMLDDLNQLAESLEGDREIKVVIFESAHPTIWVCHTEPSDAIDLSDEAVELRRVTRIYLQHTLERIRWLPQATIAQIEGVARGSGQELALACDLRFAARGKARFVKVDLAGVMPSGGGARRLASQAGFGHALDAVFYAGDCDADQAERLGTVHRAIESAEIGPFVDALARRIARYPAESIKAGKRAIHASVNTPFRDALKARAAWLYHATSPSTSYPGIRIEPHQRVANSLNRPCGWPDQPVKIQRVS